MDAKQIKTARQLTLKPNAYFPDPTLPFLYQKRGILMMLTRPRMVLGDDVGLGKTIEALVLFSYLKAARPETRALVLTEKLALQQWIEEKHKFTPGLTAKVITAGTHEDPAARVRAFRQHGADMVVTGYSSIYDYSHHIVEGLGQRWVLIADEPNYFKNKETVLYKNMRGLTVGDLEGVPYRIVRDRGKDGGMEGKLVSIPRGVVATRTYGLTATVIENKLEEAYGVFSIVAAGCFSSELQFINDYCVQREVKRGIWVTKRYKNLEKFRRQIEPYYYGRLADDPEVEQDLPEVITKDIPIVLSKEQSKKVLEAMDRLLELPTGETKQIQLLPSLTIAQQLTNDPRLMGFDIQSEKTAALLETLKGSLDGQRVLIFSRFRTMIDLLEKDLRAAGIDCVRITGKESEAERESAKQRFMSDDSDRCNVIMGTRAIIKSVNLQKGAHEFMFDIPWSYGWYRQLVGRLRRTGSTQTRIGVYRMLGCLHPEVAAYAGTHKTIDHYVLQTVMKKQKLWKDVTGDAEELDSANADVMDIWQAVREGMKR